MGLELLRPTGLVDGRVEMLLAVEEEPCLAAVEVLKLGGGGLGRRGDGVGGVDRLGEGFEGGLELVVGSVAEVGCCVV
jgi:hypothetical protein